MDLDQLQSVRDRERQTDKLQQLRDSFYEEATAFVRDLREERDRAAKEAEDPFDAPEVNRLTDQIRTAEQTIEAIYEKRVGKLVKAATFAAADLPAEADGMTAEEEDLFETLVAEIQANRRRVLDRLSGEGAATEGAGTDSPSGAGASDEEPSPTTEATTEATDIGEARDAPSERDPPDETPPDVAGAGTDGDDRETGAADVDDGSGMSAADVMQGGDAAPDPPGDDPADVPPVDGPPEGEPEEAPDGTAGPVESDDEDGDAVREDGGPTADVERELVRITDVGAIFGVDEREYELAKDDVVSLPAENARPLLERDAAERL